MFEAGNIVVLDNGKKIKLVNPVAQDKRAYGTFWIAPGYRWISSRQKFSSVIYSHLSKSEPRLTTCS